MSEPVDLSALLGERVTVTGPTNAMWAGRLVAVVAEPSVVIQLADGSRITLPQSFTIQPDESPASGGGAWLCQCGRLNQGAWNEDSICGGCRFSIDRPGYVETFYELVELPRIFDPVEDGPTLPP